MYGFEFDSNSHSLALEWCDENYSAESDKKNRDRKKHEGILIKPIQRHMKCQCVIWIPLLKQTCQDKRNKIRTMC